MLEFSDNNNISTSLSLILFYLNYNFYSRINFILDIILYKIIRKRF